MNVLPVVDVNDPRVAPFRSMRDAALMRERGLFVAEGRLTVERVVTDGRHQVDALLLNQAALDALLPALAFLSTDTPIFTCENRAFQQLTGVDIHRGCLALVRRPQLQTVAQVLDQSSVVVVLEAVTNADNVGSVFRTAAAFGVGAVLLSPTCCDPLYRKAIRTSMGAALRLNFARVEPWPAGLASLRAEGFTIVALSPREPSTPLDAYVAGRRFVTARSCPPRVALLVGTEGAGLSDAAEHEADVRVRIPIRPDVDSLNLGVATGIALSRLVK